MTCPSRKVRVLLALVNVAGLLSGGYWIGLHRGNARAEAWHALYLRQEGQCEQAFTNARRCLEALANCDARVREWK